ncbi:MAG: polyprenyl synthetase family protein [Candidatus Bathyarchaeia archaeon]
MNSRKIAEEIIEECERLGRRAYEIAKETILKKDLECNQINEAIKYFIESWHNFHHPALLAIACEAVGGKPEKTTIVGAALVLLTGAADLHDDIIDGSRYKGSKATIFGKFGVDIALLTGDALLFEGVRLLDVACRDFPKRKGETIKEIIENGFTELGVAEAMEASFKRDWNTAPEKYLEVLRRKAAVSEATAWTGAIIGNATQPKIKDWRKIGRSLGMLMSFRDEFIDIFEVEELKNRRDNECLPLPILYALCDQDSRVKILDILKKETLSEDDAFKVAEIVSKTKTVKEFEIEIQNLANKTCQKLKKYNSNNINTLIKMASSVLEDL